MNAAAVENVSLLRWAVVGGSGFVGANIVAELRQLGAVVKSVAAPRLRIAVSSTPSDIVEAASTYHLAEDELVQAIGDANVVINAAGMAVPGATMSAELIGANALLPVILANATARVSAERVIHLSSAAVQGRRLTLDETEYVEPFSPYSASKALGEQSLSLWRSGHHDGSAPDLVVVRATSVQGDGRPTTIKLKRLARTVFASVAAPGSRPTPVSSVAGLVGFVLQIGVYSGRTPLIVLQPPEGMTTFEVLRIAGGKRPIVLPGGFCKLAVRVAYLLSGASGGGMSGVVRRIELMWFGQEQNSAWARDQGLSVRHDIARVLAGPLPPRRWRNDGGA